MNVTKDENTRLKTKLAFLQQELVRKDKDIEALSIKLHFQNAAQISKDNSTVAVTNQSIIGGTSTNAGGAQGQSGSGGNGNTVFESYLVSSLKKQNRDLKGELEDKTATIDRLKRDIKLTKTVELENELQSYIEECQRLRGLLENLVYQNKLLIGAAIPNQHGQILLG